MSGHDMEGNRLTKRFLQLTDHELLVAEPIHNAVTAQPVCENGYRHRPAPHRDGGDQNQTMFGPRNNL